MNAVRMTLVCLFAISALIGRSQRIHNSYITPICITDADGFSFDEFLPLLRTAIQWPETPCLADNASSVNQVWFKFRTANTGDLTFSLTPHNDLDDIDFALYEYSDPAPQILRCMATGINMDKERATQTNCLGPTGLRGSSTDLVELKGCGENHDNFLQSVRHKDGQTFLLLVTNYTSEEGFDLYWTGSSAFDLSLCDENNSSPFTTVTVYPNPARDLVNIEISSMASVACQLDVVDHQGRTLITEPQDIISGRNVIAMKVTDLTNGVYYARIAGEGTSALAKFEVIH